MDPRMSRLMNDQQCQLRCGHAFTTYNLEAQDAHATVAIINGVARRRRRREYSWHVALQPPKAKRVSLLNEAQGRLESVQGTMCY